MTVTREHMELVHNTFGSCNWIRHHPVPEYFELRAMETEIVTGEEVNILSGYWYDGTTQTHAARVRIGERIAIWQIGACSGKWYR